MVNNIKVASLLQNQHVSLPDPPEPKPRRTFVKPTNLKLSRRGKYLLAFIIIAIVLISSFAFLSLRNNQVSIATQPQNNTSTSPSPTPNSKSKGSSIPSLSGILTGISQAVNSVTSQPKPPGVVESSPGMNDTVWTEVAENAWAFFQPSVGVDPTTGLPYAGGTGFKAFTDWDLGAYIQAVIDAEELGLINATGTWGADNRLNMVLTFLETRPLNETTGWPFWFYDATNGQGYLENTTYASDTVDLPDTGKLLVALHNIITFNSSFTQEVDQIVLTGRSNYSSLLPYVKEYGTSNSIYLYYYACGFASFWPTQVGNIPNQILTNIENTQTITTYGVTLPDSLLTNEPLLMSIFELNNSDPRLVNLMHLVYEAQEAKYNSTGIYVAYSEGSSIYNGYVYEWVIAPNGSAWQTTNATNYYFDETFSPIIFIKAAFGFLALYNDTYSRNLVIYLEENLPTPSNGYYDGVDSAGNLDAGNPGSDTNALVLDSALYYITQNPND